MRAALEAEKQETGKQRRPAKQRPSSRAPKKRLFSPAPAAAPPAGVAPGAPSAAPPAVASATITWPADAVTPTLGLLCAAPDAVEFATIAYSPSTPPTDPSNEDASCLVCCELFSASMPGEEWVQCVFCYKWSHEACTDGATLYSCHLCDKE